MRDITFSVAIFWFNFFITYSCLFCVAIWLVELLICFSLLVARKRYVFCIFTSRSFIVRSVSAMRLVRYDAVGFSMLKFNPYLSSCSSSSLKLMLVSFFYSCEEVLIIMVWVFSMFRLLLLLLL
jgi:hypothetical protein